MLNTFKSFLRISALCFLAPMLLAPTAFAQGFPNIDRPGAEGTMVGSPFALNDGRSAIIAWHNEVLYSIPEIPGSADGSNYQVRSWDFSDINAPLELGSHGTTQHPILAHGFLYRNNTLVLGNNFQMNRSFEATAVPGQNTNIAYSDMDPLYGVGGHGALYVPFSAEPSYRNYFPSQEDAQLRRMNPVTGIWETTATWDHLSLTGVGGYPFIIGNLLIYSSDASRSGIAIYDISDMESPQLLSTVTDGGPGGYWPSLWGGDGRLYAVWAYRQEFNEVGNGIRIIDITDPSDPQWVIDAPLPDEDQSQYVMFQDDYAFLGNHKFDMRSHEVVLSFPTESQGRDASQFALPLGNLVLLGGYGDQQGISTWVHQEEADTRPPVVGFHLPQDGQTNYPVSAPISLLIHEVLQTRTIINGNTILIRPVGGAALPAQFTLSFDGVLTYTPEQPLEANTSYEVVLDGIEDASGNAMEPYSFTFSTGEMVSGNAAPNVESFTADLSVVEPGETITLTAVANDDPAQTLDYRFDPGDGRPKTAWGPAASIGFEYAEPGHYQPTVQVRDDLGAIASLKTGINVMTLPTELDTTSSSSVAVDVANRRIWTVNPDNDTVTVVDADDLDVLAEVPVGLDPRSVAIDSSGRAWITLHDEDRVRVFDGASYVELAEFNTGYGSAPFGVVISPDGQTAYVSLYGSGELMRYDVNSLSPSGSPLELGYSARALAVSSDNSRVLVTRFISPQNHAEVWEVETAGFSLNRTLRIPKFGNATHRDSTANSRGVANYLASVLYDPHGESAWVAATKQNTERGLLFNAPQTHESTQRNVLVQIDLDPANPAGAVQRDIDLDNSDSASGLALSPRGDYLFVTLQGNNQFLAFDLLELGNANGFGAMTLRRNTGAAPQGVAVDPETGRILIHDFLDRGLSVYEGDPLFETGVINLENLTVSLVNNEALAPEVLSGKRIFYHAEERMSSEGYISCASCHIGGGSDSRVWDFTQRGEGLRNTPELWGRSGMGHGRVHWSGNFDEIQDFENDIRHFFSGTGFMSDEDFAATEDPLGAPKAGLSPELDDLAAYVASLDNSHLPRSPYRESDGSLSEDAEFGRQVYSAMNCALCHGGEELTDSNLDLLHDLGTLRTTSGQRLGGPLEGIDAPTLRGVWATAPYLHDGSAPTLEAVFTTAGGTVYQAEDADSVSNGVVESTDNSVYFNYDNTVTEGLVRLESGGLMTYEGVDGGASGGIGAIEFRYSSTNGGPATVWVNGIPYPATLTGTGNTLPFRMTFWGAARVENVELEPGPNNSIQIGGVFARTGIDHFTVTTQAHLLAAEPHRRVPVEIRPQLLAYLRSLDGDDVVVDDPAAPAVAIVPTEGQNDPVDWPFVEFDLNFSEPVVGFDDSDLIVEGSAGPGWLALYPIEEGLSYRVRIGGFSGDGEVSVRLNIGAAASAGFESRAAFGEALAFESPLQTPDPLAVLNDEFDDPASLSGWQRLHLTEGWNADKLETWDIDTSESGHMRLTPVASVWFADYAGPFAYREVTGDFIATVQMDVSRRDGLAGRPSSNYSYGGLMVRAPRPYTQAGLSPGSDWVAGTENRIAINYGTANPFAQPAADQWEIIVSNTINSGGTFYPSILGVPAGEATITLQIVRIGTQFTLLRQSPGGDWIIEQSFNRIDMPDTVQIGVIAGADYNAASVGGAFQHNRNVSAAGAPDVVVDVDWFRVATPSYELTPAIASALPTTGQYGPVRLLSSTAAATTLGDAGSALPELQEGMTYPQWLATYRNDDQLANPFYTDPDIAPEPGALPNLLQFVLGAETAPALHMTMAGPAEAPITQLTTTRDPSARAVTLIVESSTDLEIWNPLATSTNGEDPTGSATISESPDPIRELTVEVPADENAEFFRIRAVLGTDD